MIVAWILASLHLIALGIGLGAVWARARVLRGAIDDAAVRRALTADSWWGIAALLWIGTGVMRLMGGYEAPTLHYLRDPLFHIKMTLVAIVVLLELWPMNALMRWRLALRQGREIDAAPARRILQISMVQAILVLLIVVVATGMARHVWHAGDEAPESLPPAAAEP